MSWLTNARSWFYRVIAAVAAGVAGLLLYTTVRRRQAEKTTDHAITTANQSLSTSAATAATLKTLAERDRELTQKLDDLEMAHDAKVPQDSASVRQRLRDRGLVSDK